jgi:hypothetical protein
MPERPDTWLAIASISDKVGERTRHKIVGRGTRAQCEEARQHYGKDKQYVHPMTGETLQPNWGRVDIVHADDWQKP